MELKGVLTKEERINDLYEITDQLLEEFKECEKQTDKELNNSLYIFDHIIQIYKQIEELEISQFKVVTDDYEEHKIIKVVS